MANFTDYMEDLIINWMRNDSPVSAPTQLGLGLFKGGSSIEPELEEGIITSEQSGGGYTRKVIALTAPSSGNSSNTAEIAWDAASADWGTITHFGIFDDSSNFLMWGALTTPRTVNAGDIFKFPLGQILVSVQ